MTNKPIMVTFHAQDDDMSPMEARKAADLARTVTGDNTVTRLLDAYALAACKRAGTHRPHEDDMGCRTCDD